MAKPTLAETLRERLESKYLTKIGWTRSANEGRCVDAAGNPLPWINYSVIQFLTERLKPEFNVFEYGSGASTLWWARQVKSVTSVEHNAAWFEKMSPDLPANVTYVFREFEGLGYPTEILNHPAMFDVVMVDGRKRVRSAIAAIERLTPGGVIVWDNIERAFYEPGIAALKQAGFRELPFYGLPPLHYRTVKTSIFYRPGNCFDI